MFQISLFPSANIDSLFDTAKSKIWIHNESRLLKYQFNFVTKPDDRFLVKNWA